MAYLLTINNIINFYYLIKKEVICTVRSLDTYILYGFNNHLCFLLFSGAGYLLFGCCLDADSAFFDAALLSRVAAFF